MSHGKKHILVLPKWYPNANDPQLGIFVKNQATLIAKKYRVTVLFVMGVSKNSDVLKEKNTIENQTEEIRVYFKKSTGIFRVLNLYKFLKSQRAGLKLIEDPIDLVHVHIPIRPALLARKLRIPYIVTEHWSGHLNGNFRNKSLLYKRYYQRVIKNAKEVSAVSEQLANALANVTDKNVKIIPNNIKSSTEYISTDHTDLIQIITVSDFNNCTKNITGLLDSFSSSLRDNSKIQLSIIGDGPDKNLVESRIDKLLLGDKVTLLGRKEQKEVLRLLPKFDFYICNSNVETFGMSVAEAILAGLPVISTRCGGPEEFVDETNGILVATNDSASLTSAILKMADTYNNYETHLNQKNIDRRFGAEAVLEQWQVLYESILA